MAGNDEHTEFLRKVFPEATDGGCRGDGTWGWVVLDGVERETRCPLCSRERIAATAGRFIPPRFQEPIAVPGDVTDWAERGQRAQGLYLTGPVGTGKTHTAWIALTHWCIATGTRPHHGEPGPWDNGHPQPSVVFTRMTDLLDDLRPGADSSTQRVRHCQNAGLLVLDDIGAEKASEWTQERLYSVIDHRYANCLPLIVTSNLPPLKLVEQTGQRTASRLAEMCTVVPMTGTDRRMPAA